MLSGVESIETNSRMQGIVGSHDDRIDVREMAAQIGTIPYEILSRIGSRIERLYE